MYENFTSIRFERVDHVLVVTMDNPRTKLNSVDGEMHDELVRLFSELRREEEAHAILLTGAGGAFSAGGNLEWGESLGDGNLDFARRSGKQLLWNLVDIELPVVAAVEGPAVGVGATIALFCDAVFMAESAVLADPHVRVGAVAGDGGAVAWPLAIGPMKAKRYLLTGDKLSAEQADRLGLVTDVSADGAAHSDALAFAARLASGAPLAIKYTKLAVNQLLKDGMNKAFDYGMALEMLTIGSEDQTEALKALREGRPPHFRGR